MQVPERAFQTHSGSYNFSSNKLYFPSCDTDAEQFLEGSFSGVPEGHDGETAFTFQYSFSEEPDGLSYETVQHHLFDVTNGQITGARRLTAGSDLEWELTVDPDSVDMIELKARGTASCDDDYAICTADGKRLAGPTSRWVSPLGPTITVSAEDVTEAPGATLDFEVRLSWPLPYTWIVYWSSEDGTAIAPGDYEVAQGLVTFRAGDTLQTVSVSVVDDNVTEDPETVMLRLGYFYTDRPSGSSLPPYLMLPPGLTAGWIRDNDRTSPDRPDLEVGASVDDSSPETGGSFTLSATATNSGDGASASTTLRYYRSSDATITTSDTQVGTAAVGALAAGGTSDQSVGLTAPSSAGTYYYGACVDAVTGESDTTNNCSASVTVTVTEPPPPTSPDLTVGSASVDDSSPETGGSFTLSATVTNSGDGASASTTLRYYRSSEPVRSGAIAVSSGDIVGTDALGALAAGGTSDQSIDVVAPSVAGTYDYWACVDEVTGESSATNNCSPASVTVTVTEPPPPTVPITATFANLPATHDGQTAFTFELRFSEAPAGLSYVTVRDALVDVTNGQITHARRATQGSNLAFAVTVQPSAAAEISLSVRGLRTARRSMRFAPRTGVCCQGERAPLWTWRSRRLQRAPT